MSEGKLEQHILYVFSIIQGVFIEYLDMSAYVPDVEDEQNKIPTLRKLETILGQ
jgi:hypothetical protein